MTVSETYYNEFQCPVNIKLAEEHRLATMVTSLSGDIEEIGPDDICKCCQLPIIGKKIPLCTNNDGLEFLGVGFPMYFEYLKSRGLILLISFMVLGGYRFFYYTTGGQCEPYSRCTSYKLGYLMVSNTDFTAPDPTDGILVCLLFGIYWLYLVLSIYFARRRVVMYNSRNLTPASYTVMVRGLPKHETAKTIKDFFCKKMNEEKMGYIVKDVNVNCGYKIQSLFNLWKEKEKLCKYIYKEKALQISRLEKKDALLRIKTTKQAASGSKNLTTEVPILEAKRVSVAPKKQIFFSNNQNLEVSLEPNQAQSLMGYSQSHRDGNQDQVSKQEIRFDSQHGEGRIHISAGRESADFNQPSKTIPISMADFKISIIPSESRGEIEIPQIKIRPSRPKIRQIPIKETIPEDLEEDAFESRKGLTPRGATTPRDFRTPVSPNGLSPTRRVTQNSLAQFSNMESNQTANLFEDSREGLLPVPENNSGSDLANQQYQTNMDPNMQSYQTNLSQDSQNIYATKFISNQSAGHLAQKHLNQQSENWDSKISDGIYSSVGTQKMAEIKLKEEEAEPFNIEEYFDIDIQTCLASDNRNRNIKIPVYDISFLPKGNPEFSVAESNKQPISIPPSVHALSSRLVKTGIIVNSPIASKVDSCGGTD
jgi:hypothetical protein